MEAVTKRKRTPTKVVEAMTLTNIRPYFTVPLSKASKELGISENCLKKVCRKAGIARWPYREIADVQRTIRRIEESATMQGFEDDRTSALLTGLRLQETLLLTRGKSEQPNSDPPSKVARYEPSSPSVPIQEASSQADTIEQEISEASGTDPIMTARRNSSPEYFHSAVDPAVASSSTNASAQMSEFGPFSWMRSMPWFNGYPTSYQIGNLFQGPDPRYVEAQRQQALALRYKQLWSSHTQAQWHTERAVSMYFG